MKKIIIYKALFFLFANYATAQKAITTYYDWNKVHPHEIYSVNSAGQKTGAYKEYDQKGVIIKEYNYLNGVENGLCMDYAALENNQRVLISKSSFKSGQPDGYFVEYCRYSGYKDKVQEGQYKDGQKSGVWKEWWCDDDTRGVLKSIGAYQDGNQNGEWQTFSRNGTPLTKGSYANGFIKRNY